eukprot:490466-Rhodomonas_salina.4
MHLSWSVVQRVGRLRIDAFEDGGATVPIPPHNPQIFVVVPEPFGLVYERWRFISNKSPTFVHQSGSYSERYLRSRPGRFFYRGTEVPGYRRPGTRVPGYPGTRGPSCAGTTTTSTTTQFPESFPISGYRVPGTGTGYPCRILILIVILKQRTTAAA